MRKTCLNGAIVFTALGLVGCASGGSRLGNQTGPEVDGKSNPIYVEGVKGLAVGKSSTERCLTNATEMKGKDWKALVKHAGGCVRVKDWKSLEVTANELGHVEINSPWGAYFHSLASENTGDLPRALWMIELAMKKAPKAGLFHFQKGRVLWKLKNQKLAVAEFRAAVDQDPALLEAHVFLAVVYHREQNFDRATRSYEAALKLDGRDRASLLGLAEVHMDQGKYEKAAELFSSAVALAADDLRAHVRLAQAHEAIDGHQELALSSYLVARTLQSRGVRATLDVDVNEKINSLEKAREAKLSQQARMDGRQKTKERAPASTKGGGK